MGNSGTTYLRPEARPVPYEKLQWRAKKALDKIIGALNAATRSTKGPSDDTSIDTNRASRIVFVSGEPGSGKSTLYLTLRAMLSNTEGTSDKYSKGYKDNIAPLKKAVRWLDPLDLEVAGDEGENLLAAVLVRLIEVLSKQDIGSNTILSKPCEEAIKDLEELATGIGIAWEGNLQARAGHLDPDTFSEEVMRTQRERLGVNERLRKALNKLADNNCCGCSKETLFVLPVDDFYLKPDASLQLLRLLRMISVPRLFFLVMGDITTIEALFIEKSLADWTAVAGAEIFATLPQRQDEALARARELRARYLRKLLPPLQRETIEAMDWNEALEFNPEQLDVKDTLEKLLEERKLDDPWGEANPDAQPEPTENDNSRCKDDPYSLLKFLLCPLFSPDEKNKKKEEKKKAEESSTREEQSPHEVAPNIQFQQRNIRKAREAYTALQILDATPREIMDLWFALRNPRSQESKRPGDADPPPLLLSLIEDSVKLVIEEQNFLNEEQQADLAGVLPTRHYSVRDIQFNMDRLSLEPDPNNWEDPTQIGENEISGQAGNNQEDQNRPELQLWVRPHRSWKLAPKNNDGESEEEVGLFAKLPPRQTAWIILLHDLACKWKSDSVTGNLVKRLLKKLDDWSKLKDKLNSQWKSENNTEVKELRFRHLVKLRARWKENEVLEGYKNLVPSKDFLGWAVLKIGSTYKHFPTPNFETFRDLDRFLFIWSSGFEWLHELWKRANVAEARAKEAETEAAQKRKSADDAKTRVGDNLAQDQAQEAQNQANQAEEQAQKAEANTAQKRVKANEARDQVGGEEYVSKYIHLWGLAGCIVINEKDDKYDEFARRPLPNWFKDQLATFKTNLTNLDIYEGSKESKDWLTKIKNFKTF
jgi:energy-coupling factor transporter ATP-binding protein EcfA2